MGRRSFARLLHSTDWARLAWNSRIALLRSTETPFDERKTLELMINMVKDIDGRRTDCYSQKEKCTNQMLHRNVAGSGVLGPSQTLHATYPRIRSSLRLVLRISYYPVISTGRISGSVDKREVSLLLVQASQKDATVTFLEHLLILCSVYRTSKMCLRGQSNKSLHSSCTSSWPSTSSKTSRPHPLRNQ